MMKTRRLFLLALCVAITMFASACVEDQQQPDDSQQPDTQQPDAQDPDQDGGNTPIEPGTPIDPGMVGALDSEYQALSRSVSDARALTADEVRALHPMPLDATLTYAPSDAAGLDVIQASPVAIDTDEKTVLDQFGFVISDRQSFPTFAYGYETLYMAEVPLYVSADSLLFAVHRSYDDILKALEQQALSRELQTMLDGMRARLAEGKIADLGTGVEADADLYLAVAASLLAGERVDPVAGASRSELEELIAAADAAEGWRKTELFGVERDMDFSQFVPRGHYTDSEDLTRYFKAMMWLGRIDLRLLETQPDHSQVFHRRQFDAAVALATLLGDSERTSWERIDSTVRAFVGESDNMTPPQVDDLLAAVGVASGDLEALAQVADADLAQAIVDKRFGVQQISSHIMINGTGEGTMPLSSVFLLLGQRYVLDSHVFSNVVYDRLADRRMMPDPLDVAFGALDNDQALHLLSDELAEYPSLAGALRAMRLVTDAHDDSFWHANLYNQWLSALRALSPTATAPAGLPATMQTEAWGRRLLNTQLASWAELRHDTLLYAKQSYSAGVTCEFPDAYVDPYPAFYASLDELALHGQQVAAALDIEPWLAERIDAYFQRLHEVSATLGEMAQQELDGVPFTETQMAFINQAVRLHWGCGDPEGASGWYGELFFQMSSATDFDPTIADVHTQPTDAVGNPVGRVLHVGTGLPRLMVVTVETCNGPRAYAGLASSYFEVVTEQFDRLDDERWSEDLQQTTPSDVSWMQDLVVR